MLAVLDITFPIFALIALGFALTRRGLFAPSDMSVLGSFAVNAALPALIFNAMISRPLAEVVDFGYLTAYTAATIATMGLTFGLMTLAGQRATRRMIGVLGVACSNSGYMGFPVMMLAWPDLAGVVLTQQVIIENFVAIPLALIAVEFATRRLGAHPLRLAVNIFSAMLRRPMIIAVIAGLCWNLSGLPLPSALGNSVRILAAAASAVALFYIGGTLAGVRWHPGNGVVVVIIVAVKLLAMPLLAAGAVLAAPWLGLPAVSPALSAPLILSAAMPMMGIFPVLAQDYGEQEIAAITLLVGTALSFVTVSLLLAVIHPAAL